MNHCYLGVACKRPCAMWSLLHREQQRNYQALVTRLVYHESMFEGSNEMKK